MNAVVNPNLFKHRESTTSGFNNLCTIIHRLRAPGRYFGSVVCRDRLLGSFELDCQKEAGAAQVDIDISKFDAVLNASAQKNPHPCPTPKPLTVMPDGYVVFFASEHHSGVYVTLAKAEEVGQKTVFDSRKLSAGDLVVFRLLYPGDYKVIDRTGSATLTLRVREEKQGRYPQPTKLSPAMVTLTEKGFDPSRLEKWPAQALVIRLEKAAVLELIAEELNSKRVGAR